MCRFVRSLMAFVCRQIKELLTYILTYNRSRSTLHVWSLQLLTCSHWDSLCVLGLIIIIIIITTTMFMVLSSWHSHCESSPGSFDECRLSAGWPPTRRPNQPIWAVSPPKDWLLPSADTIAIYYYYSARKLILILPSHGGWKADST